MLDIGDRIVPPLRRGDLQTLARAAIVPDGVAGIATLEAVHVAKSPRLQLALARGCPRADQVIELHGLSRPAATACLVTAPRIFAAIYGRRIDDRGIAPLHRGHGDTVPGAGIPPLAIAAVIALARVREPIATVFQFAFPGAGPRIDKVLQAVRQGWLVTS